jgi:hypothetical protein
VFLFLNSRLMGGLCGMDAYMVLRDLCFIASWQKSDTLQPQTCSFKMAV